MYVVTSLDDKVVRKVYDKIKLILEYIKADENLIVKGKLNSELRKRKKRKSYW